MNKNFLIYILSFFILLIKKILLIISLICCQISHKVETELVFTSKWIKSQTKIYGQFQVP